MVVGGSGFVKVYQSWCIYVHSLECSMFPVWVEFIVQVALDYSRFGPGCSRYLIVDKICQLER